MAHSYYSTKMRRRLAIVFIALLPVLAAAQRATPTGEWRVRFVAPLGQRVVTMTINEDQGKITGHIVDEFGEYQIRGTFSDRSVTIVWSVSEDGKPLEITMKGTLDGDVITGTATLGDVGEGTLSAQRIE